MSSFSGIAIYLMESLLKKTSHTGNRTRAACVKGRNPNHKTIWDGQSPGAVSLGVISGSCPKLHTLAKLQRRLNMHRYLTIDWYPYHIPSFNLPFLLIVVRIGGGEWGWGRWMFKVTLTLCFSSYCFGVHERVPINALHSDLTRSTSSPIVVFWGIK